GQGGRPAAGAFGWLRSAGWLGDRDGRPVGQGDQGVRRAEHVASRRRAAGPDVRAHRRWWGFAGRDRGGVRGAGLLGYGRPARGEQPLGVAGGAGAGAGSFGWLAGVRGAAVQPYLPAAAGGCAFVAVAGRR